VLDFNSDFGQRIARRLGAEQIIWLTTVGPDLTPQPNPVWFLWDGATFLIYSQPDRPKLRNIRLHQRVSLNLDAGPSGEDVGVLLGEARIEPDAPPATQVAAYIEKYKTYIAALKMTPESFAQSYSVTVRVTPDRLRGF
jgi:PPOX class probable F420-dependent enzyme